VRHQARRHPDAVAVTLDGSAGQLTYRALERWAGQLAGRLTRHGVTAESRVGILLDRSLALPVAMLAVLQRGAAYVPLDPADPPERLGRLVWDAAIDVVVTSGALRDRLPANVTAVEPEPGGPVAAPAPVHPDQAAYLIYTSGSTGHPKGVVISHAGIVNRLRWMQEALGLTPADRVVHKAPTSFDVSLWELFWPLTQGGCLVLAPPGAHRDPFTTAEVLRRQQVTTAHFVPSVLAALLANAGPGPLPALARVVCSGEALPARLRDQCLHALPAALYNLYGPTEASVDVTAWHCRPGDTGPPPIGHAIANTDVHVLDGELEPVPANVPGEICIRGVALARGYLRRAGLTAAAFRPDPFGSGGRIYRTGDRARRRADGAVSYLGRDDQQVKLTGNRVELGEVEEALRALPGIRAAAAAVHDDGRGPQLVGYLVGAAAADPESLREQLRTRLPAVQIPAHLVALDSLPSTANGKLDRRALPAPATPLRRRTPAAGTEAEQRIARLWADVLGVADVGIDDDFYALGGDSITAVRLVAAMRESGLAVTVVDLVSTGTVRRLAAAVTETEITDDDPAPFALCRPEARAALPPGADDAYPISMAQQAVLFQQLHNPGHEVYVTDLRLRGRFNAAAMRAAVAATARRHPYLRSSFDLTHLLQIVHREFSPPLEIVDLRGGTAARVADWLRSERKRPFDVTREPLARFTVHRVTDDAFHLTLSSFALDGWCTATVLVEVLAEYAARSSGQPSPLPAVDGSYASFVALELAALRSAETRAFWADELDDAPPCLVPRQPDPTAAPLTGRVAMRVEADVHERLLRLARELGVPLKSMLLAAHLRVVRTLTAQSTVLTGLELHGRPERRDGDRIVGVFNNIVPLRMAMPSGSWANLIRAAAAAERRLMPHRRYPLVQLQRDHRVQQRFNTLFVYTHFHVYERLTGIEGIDLVDGDAPDRTYVDLTAHFNVDAATGALRLLLDYDPTQISDRFAESAASYYERALRQLAADPDRSYGAESLLAPAVLADRVAQATSPRPARGDGTVHAAALRQAAVAPDAVAVTGGGAALTYAALAARSARLAAALRTAGIGPGAVVGLACDDGVERIVALLAILRAGAAYLPLDSTGPDARVASVITASGARAVVADPARHPPVPPGCQVISSSAAAHGKLPPVHPASLAYVLSTSGTTGQPKLIGVPHSAVLNYAHMCADRYGLAPGMRALSHSSITFDLTVTALLAPLATGGTVDLLPDDAGPEALGAALARDGSDLLKITPAHLEAVGRQLRLLAVTPQVGCVVVGGEPLRHGHLAPWAGLGHVVNEYGPTEATVGCCTYRMADDSADPVPIGRPIAGTSAHVLDDGLPVPAGVAGELFVGGACLARGYLGQPGLTAERYVPDPFGLGARLFRTGDRACWEADGHLRFLGRLDRQVKVRGYRIEPAEIEHALRQHPAVREAVVAGSPRFIAYWVPDGADDVPEQALRHWLAERLAAYLVPDGFVRLPALPLTRRGKVDHAALSDPDTARRHALLTFAEGLDEEAVRDLLATTGRGAPIDAHLR
jgi:amino acid adenylation domain-containing protein